MVLGESREVLALVEYTAGLRFTRRAQLNDDLSAFARGPVLLGNSAKRKEDDVCYAVVTANAAMGEDSVALFDNATHGNLAAAGAALSVATLGAGRAAMRKQKGLKAAARLNLAPKHLLVPVEIETVAEQLIGSIVDPAMTNATINPFANKLEITAEARLSDDSATQWYLACDPNQMGTVVVTFLADEPAPVAASETEFDTDDLKLKIRHTVAAGAENWRGMYCNPGV